jgi:hypothetical protein
MRYLSIPANAEFVIAVMRGVVAAIGAEAIEPLGSVVRKKLTTRSKIRH